MNQKQVVFDTGWLSIKYSPKSDKRLQMSGVREILDQISSYAIN